MGAGDLGLVGRILRIFPVGGASPHSSVGRWGEKEVARRWGGGGGRVAPPPPWTPILEDLSCGFVFCVVPRPLNFIHIVGSSSSASSRKIDLCVLWMKKIGSSVPLCPTLCPQSTPEAADICFSFPSSFIF
jgi:hypothetical protein